MIDELPNESAYLVLLVPILRQGTRVVVPAHPVLSGERMASSGELAQSLEGSGIK
jgi:hypothetical protein